MVSSALVFLLLPLSISFLFNQFYFVSGDEILIEKVCNAGHDYDLCISIIQSDPIADKLDAKGLVGIVLRKAEANASATYTYIENQMKENETVLGEPGRMCGYEYGDAIQDLQSSLKDLENGRYTSAGINASSARERVKTCGTDFARLGRTYPSDLQQRELMLEHLCDMSNYIISSGILV